MSVGPIIRRVDANSSVFLRTWKKLPHEIREEAIQALKDLKKSPRPASLHFHKMRGFAGIWTIHLSKNDRYKASLSIDGDVAVMRRCGTHEEVDRNPE